MFKIIDKIKFQTIPWGFLAVTLITLIFSVPFTIFFIWTFLLMHLFIWLLGDKELKSIFKFKNPWLVTLGYLVAISLIILLGFLFAYLHNFLVRVVPFDWKQFDSIIFWMIFGLWVAVSSMRKIFNIGGEKIATILTALPVIICLGLLVMAGPKKMVRQLHGITILNNLKKGFYFEKYDTRNEAKKALLQMHPVGSSVEALIKDLEQAGAVNGGMGPDDKNVYFKEVNRSISYKNLVYLTYRHSTLDHFFPRIWKVFIEREEDKILNIFISFYQGG